MPCLLEKYCQLVKRHSVCMEVNNIVFVYEFVHLWTMQITKGVY